MPDVLREAGDKVRLFWVWRQPYSLTLVQGLHVREIAAVRNVDASKLGALRLSGYFCPGPSN